ncbi:inorganic phosphate transporter [Escherichia coli O25b:H4-ST131]|uniref:inorganic phosphate transporter n=1 Tax=Escherichia coli TaxID=562 RepID=UPI0021758333|nr:inorganic phosphate transporter [Escherichia coli]UWC13825.1 inorganic phosphate transporter [Escherichia coli O25b:H4-ST131]
MLNLFVGLDIYTGLLLLLALAFVLFYEAINGFHDTANAVATVIYTRAMQPQLAVVMAAFFNFFGVLLGGLSVAYAIVHMLPTDLLLNMGSTHGLAMVFSMLLAAIIWNLGTWFFGLPASSSHTLIGAIIGIGLTNALLTGSSVMDALNLREVTKIFSSLIVSPIVGLVIAGGLIFLLRRFWSGTKKRDRIHRIPEDRKKKKGKRKPPFWTRIALIVSAAGVAFSHGANDGPLCAAAMLAIHPLAPLGLLMAAPVLALLMLLRLPGTPPQPTPECKSVSLKRDCLPYLLCAILLAAAVSMMQLGLSPALTRQFATDTTAISQQVAWLLGLSAVAALIAQFGVLRPQRLTPVALLLSAGVLMSGGLAIMLSEQLWLFYPGCAVLSFGAALATPAYQLLLNDKLADGAGAGWLATSHTLGYGLCALLVPLVSKTGVAIALIMAALFATILFTIVSVFIWHYRTIK